MQKVNSKDGTTIAYNQAGSGPAVILVDGALCYRAFGPMGALAPLLAPHFTVINYDRRGRGDSSDTLPYAIERELEDLEALINVAGGSACVYGVSSGAALALEAAASGLPIRKLALYEPPYTSDPAAQQAFEDYITQLRALLADEQYGNAVAHFMGYVGMPAEQIEGMRQTPIWPQAEAIAPTLAYDGAVLGEGAAVPTARAAEVPVPTLAMAGGASFPFMHQTAQALQQAIPQAQYRVLEGQTHDAAAEAVAPVLIEFFA